MDDVVRELVEARMSTYGDPHKGNKEVGRVWGAILSRHLNIEVPDLPMDVVSLMKLADKLMRATRGSYHKDNYNDMHAYTYFADEEKRRDER